jgi:hypothetical protein
MSITKPTMGSTPSRLSIVCMDIGGKNTISRRECVPLKKSITKVVVSIWHLNAHFVAMEMEFQKVAMDTENEHGYYKMVVFDGYNVDKHWKFDTGFHMLRQMFGKQRSHAGHGETEQARE